MQEKSGSCVEPVEQAMTSPIDNLDDSAPAALGAGDPRLDSLLDEALSHRTLPGGLPAGLNQRILAASLPLLPQTVSARPALKLTGTTAQETYPQGVIAKLNLIWWVRSLAASIVVAATLGIVLTAVSIFQGAQETVVINELDYDLNQAVASASHTPTARGTYWSQPVASRGGNGTSGGEIVVSDAVRISNEANAAMRSIDAALRAMEDESATPANPGTGDSSSGLFPSVRAS